jgi:His/Glu/Gln/Arg/opine family amino acid ABC transporter permease subunit
LLVWLFLSLHLDFGFTRQKLPFLLGLRLSPDGFIQGAALTLFVTACSMVSALIVALLTALGRMSSNPLGFGIATFYASLFRGTPLLVQVLIFYLALPQVGIVLGALSAGIHCTIAQLRSLSGRDHPQRHDGRPSGAARSGDGVGVAALADHLENHRVRRHCASLFHPPAPSSFRCSRIPRWYPF